MSEETQRLEAQRLGMRSPFVLAKIGHDLRQEYNRLIEQPLPEDIAQAVNRLPQRPVLHAISRTPSTEVRLEPKAEAHPAPVAAHP
jgi:hypothetical protein